MEEPTEAISVKAPRWQEGGLFWSRLCSISPSRLASASDSTMEKKGNNMCMMSLPALHEFFYSTHPMYSFMQPCIDSANARIHGRMSKPHTTSSLAHGRNCLHEHQWLNCRLPHIRTMPVLGLVFGISDFSVRWQATVFVIVS